MSVNKPSISSRPYVMSIAGFDPSAGAGVLSDIKCFEQHEVYGFGVCSAMTTQTDAMFIGCKWLNAEEIIAQIKPLMEKFEIKACKIALIKDVGVLLEVVSFIKSNTQDTKIILDPVLKSSSGYALHLWKLQELIPVLGRLELITPNYLEMQQLGDNEDAEQSAAIWSSHCSILLKGGHNSRALGTDFLFNKGKDVTIYKTNKISMHQKHGSGCVLSASITANLALGLSLEEACKEAKYYTGQFLNSNASLLGYHLNNHTNDDR